MTLLLFALTLRKVDVTLQCVDLVLASPLAPLLKRGEFMVGGGGFGGVGYSFWGLMLYFGFLFFTLDRKETKDYPDSYREHIKS